MTTKPDKRTIHAWVQLHRSHRRLLEIVESNLKDAGLPPLTWYDVLLELHGAGKAGLRQYEIGERILLNKHNLSRLVDRLEANRLLERHTCEEDARGNRIRITGAGEQMLKRVWPVYGRAIEENFGARLTAGECKELGRILSKTMADDDAS